MADYIDRERLIKAIPSPKQDQSISLIGAVADMFCIINAAQKEDVAPVVSAHWIKITGMRPPEHAGRHVCSECGGMALENRMREVLSEYCPHCGAKLGD